MSARNPNLSYKDAAEGIGHIRELKAKCARELSKEISTEAKLNYNSPTNMPKQNPTQKAQPRKRKRKGTKLTQSNLTEMWTKQPKKSSGSDSDISITKDEDELSNQPWNLKRNMNHQFSGQAFKRYKFRSDSSSDSSSDDEDDVVVILSSEVQPKRLTGQGMVELFLRRLSGNLDGLSDKDKFPAELMRLDLLAGLKVYGGAVADGLRGAWSEANDIDIDVPKSMSHYRAFEKLDEVLQGPFPYGYDTQQKVNRNADTFLDTEHGHGANDGSIRDITYKRGEYKIKQQFVHSYRYGRKANLDGCQFEVVMKEGEPILRTRSAIDDVDAVLEGLSQKKLTLLRAQPYARVNNRCKNKEDQGWTIDYEKAKDWPANHQVPPGAATADAVFPPEFGIEAPRVLARTSTEKCAQEAAMVMKIIAEVEKYNSTVPVENGLSAYKAFEKSKADVIICKKGTEVYLPGGKTIDITSKDMSWVGLQVKTGSAVLSMKTTNKFPYLQFASVDNYGDLIALMCSNQDDHDESFYFDPASQVEEYSRSNMLFIPVNPKQKQKIASIQKLRSKHQVAFAAIPAKLFDLYSRHAKAGTLMSWRDANAPAAKGKSPDLKELEAHIEVFANLHKVGLPTPVLPDVDGLHHDWTLLGKKIQAKVASKRIKQNAWVASHTESLGRTNRRAVSYGAYDFLWMHCGADMFILLPASTLRRHSTYLGQGTSGNGRTNLYLYPDTSPTRGDSPKWKKLCEPYVCSWSDEDLLAKVKQILSSC